MVRWCIGGLLLGCLAGFVWVVVRVYFNAELAILASVVGAAVGLGVRLSMKDEDDSSRELAGGVALVLAIVTVIGAKYVGWYIVLGSVSSALGADIGKAYELTRENLVVSVADEIVAEREERNQPIAWPAGVTAEEAVEEADYPPELWQEAEKRWDGFTDEERQRRETEFEEAYAAIKEMLGQISFWSSFDFYDILWFLLAAGAAAGIVIRGDEDD